MNTFAAHQGDISFNKYQGEISGKKEKHNGSIIIAFGEATGHNHTLTVERPQDLEIVKVADGYIFKLKSEGTITHQEHKPIKLSPGTYRSGREREFDWFQLAPRKVID